VVPTPELPRPLDRDNVLRLLDDADDAAVTPRVQAYAALFLLRDIAAHRTEPDLVLDLEQCVREAAYVGGIGLEDMEGYPLCALGTDAGKPAQLVDEVLNNAFVHGCSPLLPTAGPGPSPEDECSDER
jgi:hypothetical protein